VQPAGVAHVPAVCVRPCRPQPWHSGDERAAQALDLAVGVARGGQARDPGLRTTSTRRNMPMKYFDASALALLLESSMAGELIPEIFRHDLQQLIELEVAAVLGTERHERGDDPLGYRSGYRPRNLATEVGDIDLMIPLPQASPKV